MLTYFANPHRFMALKAALSPYLWGGAAMLIGYGLYLALWVSPPDYQQKDTVRLMYVHVPAAWLSLGIYTAMAIAAFMAHVWRHTLAGLFVRAAAPAGAAFTLVCLVTGSVWGKPMWGTWWVWDARLTSVLVLFFFYVGYIVLADAFDDEDQGLRAGGFLVMAGAINIPIIKFSVDWWHTLHQPASVFRMDGPTIHGDMLAPLFVMAAGFSLMAAAVIMLRLETAVIMRRLRVRAAMQHAGQQAQGAGQQTQEIDHA